MVNVNRPGRLQLSHSRSRGWVSRIAGSERADDSSSEAGDALQGHPQYEQVSIDRSA